MRTAIAIRLWLAATAALAVLPALAGCGKTEAPAAASSQSGESRVAAPGLGSSQTAASAPAPAAIADITFDTIKLALEKNEEFRPELITPAVRNLEGRTVRLRGYMLPSYQQSDIAQFVLVRDNMQCCFGPGAALHDCVVVDMLPGKSTEYTLRPVAVEGKFSVRIMKDPDGKTLAIYNLAGQEVR